MRHIADGPRHVYTPTQSRERVRKSAVIHLVNTFFGGSRAETVAALLDLDGHGARRPPGPRPRAARRARSPRYRCDLARYPRHRLRGALERRHRPHDHAP